MKAVIVISHKELSKLLACKNSSAFLLHKGCRLFIDTIKSYNCPLIANDYEFTRTIVNESSKFHPHLVELITVN